MYIKREISNNVLRLFKQFPIVTITGPRQSGKSTLCKKLFSKLPYFSLEDIDHRDFAVSDPRGFLTHCGKKAIIDEIQRVPQLLSYIQTHVDKQGINGQFILTGSSQFELMEAVTQSLAGRTALLRLLPFSLAETKKANKNKELNAYNAIFHGFYPRVVVEKQLPPEMFAFYTRTYIERDVRQILNIQDLRLFEIFLKLCAGRTGQLLNYSELSSECGIDVKTAKRWISVLEASYIVKIIHPYYRNLNKRLVKTPKLFFYDTGLACFLLGIRQPEHLVNHPLYGALFETYVIGELLKNAYNQVKEDDLYFFRDNRGREVDIVHDRVSEIDIMEIKSAATINNSFFKGLDYVQTLPLQVRSSHLIYGGNGSYKRQGAQINSWQSIPKLA